MSLALFLAFILRLSVVKYYLNSFTQQKLPFSVSHLRLMCSICAKNGRMLMLLIAATMPYHLSPIAHSLPVKFLA